MFYHKGLERFGLLATLDEGDKELGKFGCDLIEAGYILGSQEYFHQDTSHDNEYDVAHHEAAEDEVDAQSCEINDDARDRWNADFGAWFGEM